MQAPTASARAQTAATAGRPCSRHTPPVTRETVSALAIAPSRPETIYAITADFGQSVVDTRRRTHHDLQVDRRRHDLAGNNSRSRGCRPHRTRRRSARSGHRLRGDQRQRHENDQRRQDLAADRPRPPDLAYPRSLSLPLPRGRHGAGGRPTPQRHRLRGPDPGRHLQDHQRRTNLDSAPSDMSSSYAVAVDPARPTTVYAAGEGQCGPTAQSCSTPSPSVELWIFRSTNSGRTWAIAG